MHIYENTKTWVSVWLKKFGQGAVCHVEKSLYRDTICLPLPFIQCKVSTIVISQECWSFWIMGKRELASDKFDDSCYKGVKDTDCSNHLVKELPEVQGSFRTKKALCACIIKLTFHCNTQTIIITLNAFLPWEQGDFSPFLLYVCSCCVSLSLSTANQFPLSLPSPLFVYNHLSVLDWVPF